MGNDSGSTATGQRDRGRMNWFSFETEKKTRSKQGQKACHQKRAALGVWAATSSPRARRAIIDWKNGIGNDSRIVDTLSAAISRLILEWNPVLPQDTIITWPPQGASYPMPYKAEMIGRAIALRLSCKPMTTLTRQSAKRWHGPHHSLIQDPFIVVANHSGMALVIDDLLTSGATMKNSLLALRSSNIMAFGFVAAGC